MPEILVSLAAGVRHRLELGRAMDGGLRRPRPAPPGGPRLLRSLAVLVLAALVMAISAAGPAIVGVSATTVQHVASSNARRPVRDQADLRHGVRMQQPHTKRVGWRDEGVDGEGIGLEEEVERVDRWTGAKGEEDDSLGSDAGSPDDSTPRIQNGRAQPTTSTPHWIQSLLCPRIRHSLTLNPIFPPPSTAFAVAFDDGFACYDSMRLRDVGDCFWDKPLGGGRRRMQQQLQQPQAPVIIPTAGSGGGGACPHVVDIDDEEITPTGGWVVGEDVTTGGSVFDDDDDDYDEEEDDDLAGKKRAPVEDDDMSPGPRGFILLLLAMAYGGFYLQRMFISGRKPHRQGRSVTSSRIAERLAAVTDGHRLAKPARQRPPQVPSITTSNVSSSKSRGGASGSGGHAHPKYKGDGTLREPSPYRSTSMPSSAAAYEQGPEPPALTRRASSSKSQPDHHHQQHSQHQHQQQQQYNHYVRSSTSKDRSGMSPSHPLPTPPDMSITGSNNSQNGTNALPAYSTASLLPPVAPHSKVRRKSRQLKQQPSFVSARSSFDEGSPSSPPQGDGDSVDAGRTSAEIDVGRESSLKPPPSIPVAKVAVSDTVKDLREEGPAGVYNNTSVPTFEISVPLKDQEALNTDPALAAAAFEPPQKLPSLFRKLVTRSPSSQAGLDAKAKPARKTSGSTNNKAKKKASSATVLAPLVVEFDADAAQANRGPENADSAHTEPAPTSPLIPNANANASTSSHRRFWGLRSATATSTVVHTDASNTKPEEVFEPQPDETTSSTINSATTASSSSVAAASTTNNVAAPTPVSAPPPGKTRFWLRASSTSNASAAVPAPPPVPTSPRPVTPPPQQQQSGVAGLHLLLTPPASPAALAGQADSELPITDSPLASSAPPLPPSLQPPLPPAAASSSRAASLSAPSASGEDEGGESHSEVSRRSIGVRGVLSKSSGSVASVGQGATSPPAPTPMSPALPDMVLTNGGALVKEQAGSSVMRFWPLRSTSHPGIEVGDETTGVSGSGGEGGVVVEDRKDKKKRERKKKDKGKGKNEDEGAAAVGGMERERELSNGGGGSSISRFWSKKGSNAQVVANSAATAAAAGGTAVAGGTAAGATWANVVKSGAEAAGTGVGEGTPDTADAPPDKKKTVKGAEKENGGGTWFWSKRTSTHGSIKVPESLPPYDTLPEGDSVRRGSTSTGNTGGNEDDDTSENKVPAASTGGEKMKRRLSWKGPLTLTSADIAAYDKQVAAGSSPSASSAAVLSSRFSWLPIRSSTTSTSIPMPSPSSSDLSVKNLEEAGSSLKTQELDISSSRTSSTRSKTWSLLPANNSSSSLNAPSVVDSIDPTPPMPPAKELSPVDRLRRGSAPHSLAPAHPSLPPKPISIYSNASYATEPDDHMESDNESHPRRSYDLPHRPDTSPANQSDKHDDGTPGSSINGPPAAGTGTRRRRNRRSRRRNPHAFVDPAILNCDDDLFMPSSHRDGRRLGTHAADGAPPHKATLLPREEEWYPPTGGMPYSFLPHGGLVGHPMFLRPPLSQRDYEDMMSLGVGAGELGYRRASADGGHRSMRGGTGESAMAWSLPAVVPSRRPQDPLPASSMSSSAMFGGAGSPSAAAAAMMMRNAGLMEDYQMMLMMQQARAQSAAVPSSPPQDQINMTRMWQHQQFLYQQYAAAAGGGAGSYGWGYDVDAAPSFTSSGRGIARRRSMESTASSYSYQSSLQRSDRPESIAESFNWRTEARRERDMAPLPPTPLHGHQAGTSSSWGQIRPTASTPPAGVSGPSGGSPTPRGFGARGASGVYPTQSVSSLKSAVGDSRSSSPSLYSPFFSGFEIPLTQQPQPPQQQQQQQQRLKSSSSSIASSHGALSPSTPWEQLSPPSGRTPALPSTLSPNSPSSSAKPTTAALMQSLIFGATASKAASGDTASSSPVSPTAPSSLPMSPLITVSRYDDEDDDERGEDDDHHHHHGAAELDNSEPGIVRFPGAFPGLLNPASAKTKRAHRGKRGKKKGISRRASVLSEGSMVSALSRTEEEEEVMEIGDGEVEVERDEEEVEEDEVEEEDEDEEGEEEDGFSLFDRRLEFSRRGSAVGVQA